jgi:hypothetical protein
MSELIAAVIVPPYCGVPRLSHQFPVEVVVAAVVTTADEVVDVGAVVELVVVTTADVVVVVVLVVLVVLAEPQDASTIDATMRKLSAIQIILFFI